MTKTLRLLVALAASAAWASDLPKHGFAIDPAQTSVEFKLGSTLHTIHGTFRLTHGDLRFDPVTGAASGELAIDAGSGDSGSATRDKRMNKSILESPKFPEIVFRPDRIEGSVAPDGHSEVQLHGVFVLLGERHEMTLPLLVDASGGKYSVISHFVIPYVKWGLKNPSTLILRVDDKVEITVKTLARNPS